MQCDQYPMFSFTEFEKSVSPPCERTTLNEEGIRSRAGAIVVLFGLERSHRADGGEVNRVSSSSPTPPITPPDSPESIIIVANEVYGEPVIMETGPGGSHGVWVHTAQISVVEMLLFLERAKAGGLSRIQLEITSDF